MGGGQKAQKEGEVPVRENDCPIWTAGTDSDLFSGVESTLPCA